MPKNNMTYSLMCLVFFLVVGECGRPGYFAPIIWDPMGLSVGEISANGLV